MKFITLNIMADLQNWEMENEYNFSLNEKNNILNKRNLQIM